MEREEDGLRYSGFESSLAKRRHMGQNRSLEKYILELKMNLGLQKVYLNIQLSSKILICHPKGDACQ